MYKRQVQDGLDDNQDRIPVKEHEKIIGHAVRANYLYAGIADLCAEIDDPEYRSVLDKMWRNLADQKLYLTGGCGAIYNGASPYGNFFVHQLVHPVSYTHLDVYKRQPLYQPAPTNAPAALTP